ncbi:hypothetical protein GGX14DRAFT_589183 [Mycena pura]|uniref:Uncharacterized protein n=1 Tax=Mycena pura TaxID=153505 RepID=A0AAD6UYV9_9AGAR|nr:hypothetical protein GGX14DRAFT_589183 [Mycena pura]
MAIWMGAFGDGFIDALGLASSATATYYVILHGFPTIAILIAIIVVSCALVIPLRIILEALAAADPLFGFLTRLRISQIIHMFGILIVGAGQLANTLLSTVGGLFMQLAEGVDAEDMGAVSTDGNVDSGGDEGPVGQDEVPLSRVSGESEFSKWSLFNAVPPSYSLLPQSDWQD